MPQYNQAISRVAYLPVHLKRDEGWKNYTETGIKISGIPAAMTTWDIWKMFSTYGNISRIDISSKRMEAFINFS
jgi:hypothetical protein